MNPSNPHLKSFSELMVQALQALMTIITTRYAIVLQECSQISDVQIKSFAVRNLHYNTGSQLSFVPTNPNLHIFCRLLAAR